MDANLTSHAQNAPDFLPEPQFDRLQPGPALHSGGMVHSAALHSGGMVQSGGLHSRGMVQSGGLQLCSPGQARVALLEIVLSQFMDLISVEIIKTIGNIQSKYYLDTEYERTENW